MSNEIDDEVDEAAEDDFADGEELDEPDEPDEDDVVEADLEEDIVLDESIEDFVDPDAETIDEDSEDEEEEEAPPKARKVTDDEDEDDEQDPDDVEADLEAILRDRMAAAEDEEDEEGEDGAEGGKADGQSGPRNDEFVCDSCFLLVNRSQFGSAKDPRCPMGDTECPSIVRIFGS